MSRFSIIRTLGPDDDDTVEHVKLETCHSILVSSGERCANPATYYDRYCSRCREEIDALRPDDVRPEDWYPRTKL